MLVGVCAVQCARARSLAQNTYFLIIHLIGLVCAAQQQLCPSRSPSVSGRPFASRITMPSLLLSLARFGWRLTRKLSRFCVCVAYVRALSLLFY